jgi:hypothetical protein
MRNRTMITQKRTARAMYPEVEEFPALMTGSRERKKRVRRMLV